MKKLQPKLRGQAIVSAKNARSLGLSRATLTRMVRDNRLERISRGIYMAADHDDGGDDAESSYVIATLRCGLPSAVCLLSALEHYKVTDRISKQTWILVPQSKRVVSKSLKLIRTRNPHWEIGIRKNKKYWITTLERTLVECLLYKEKLGSQTALEALRNALSRKKVKLADVYDMAKKLKVDHRVAAYIEALST
jgi:predicted transcriptional regulator of viral defense system